MTAVDRTRAALATTVVAPIEGAVVIPLAERTVGSLDRVGEQLPKLVEIQVQT
ncbi:hypothetical protein [Nocardia fluminea]|uniref:hypothetical protein n=1 Tax=Nocardia fluminea TaxID=134984 RepID=UPI003F4D6FFF